jgi:hypothetical protein
VQALIERFAPLAHFARRFSLVLPGFLLLSGFAHLATFFLFQVAYPQRVTIPPPAAQVALLTAATPEGEALLRWVAAEDPALVAATSSPLPRGLLDLEYVPSFATVRTPPRTLAPAPEVVRYPAAKHPLAIIRSVEPADIPTAPELPPSETRLSFSGALAERQVIEAPPVRAQLRSPLEPPSFLVGVSGDGEVRFAFVQRTSGDDAADAAAAAALTQARFEVSEAPITWGFATVTWGGNAYAAPAPAIESRP